MASVLTVFEFPGDSEDLRQRYDKLLDRVVEVSSARPLIHLAVPTEAGFNVYDVWDSEEVFRRFSDNQDFKQTLADFGMPAATIRVYPVHNLGWPISEVPRFR